MLDEEIPMQTVTNEPVPDSTPLSDSGQESLPQEEVSAVPAQEPVPEPAQATAQALAPQTETMADRMKNLSAKALFAIQTRKKEKLEKIMTLFDKKTEVTNDQVEKLLHISDATATRYLEILVEENKITKVGVRGRQVFYTKV